MIPKDFGFESSELQFLRHSNFKLFFKANYIDIKDKHGRCPLHCAALFANVEGRAHFYNII